MSQVHVDLQPAIITLMKRLHTFQLWEGPQAGMYKEMLAKEGVACLVKNDDLLSAVGELPFVECFPELWVLDNEVFPRARLLMDGWLRQDIEHSKEPWLCSECGESCAAQFMVCWNCLNPRD